MIHFKYQRGITLLEVLAVLALLTLVAFLLFPVFAKAHEHSYEPHCQSNLKQLGIGFTQYVQDYDGQFPAVGKDGTGWAAALYPYEKSTGVFKCPSDTLVATTGAFPESYAMNSNLSAAIGPMAKYRRQVSLASPAVTVLAFETDGAIMDMTQADEYTRPGVKGYHSPVGNGLSPVPGTANLTSGGLPVTYATGDIGSRGCPPSVCPATTRHDPSGFYLATDGHVKMLRPESVSSGTVPAVRSPQTGKATSGTAASADKLDTRYRLTFSAR
jgi:hypothetical protein